MNPLRRRLPVDARGWTTAPRAAVRRPSRRGVVAFLVVALAGGLFVSVPPPNVSADALSNAYAQQRQLEKEIAAQKAQLAALTAQQANLSAQLASTQNTLSGVVQDLTAVRTQIVGMVVNVAKAQAAVDELDATVAQLDQQLADLEAQQQAKADQLAARQAILASRIQSAYDTSRTSLLETILSSSDFNQVLSQIGYQMSFADQDKALAQQIAQDQQVLGVLQQNSQLMRSQADTLREAAAAQQATLAKELGQLNAAQATLAALQARYQALFAAQQAQAAQLAANKTKVAAQIRAEQVAAQKIQALIDRLVVQAMQLGGIPSAYSGTLHWPMPGIITQPFGCTGFYMEPPWSGPPYGSCAHFHTGIDTANTLGTPIHADGPGKVIYVGQAPYDPAYIVIIAHAANLWSGFWHVLPNIPVHVGQFVNTGQVIAFEGCTGWCTGPHLHWQVELNNIPVNPQLFL